MPKRIQALLERSARNLATVDHGRWSRVRVVRRKGNTYAVVPIVASPLWCIHGQQVEFCPDCGRDWAEEGPVLMGHLREFPSPLWCIHGQRVDFCPKCGRPWAEEGLLAVRYQRGEGAARRDAVLG